MAAQLAAEDEAAILAKVDSVRASLASGDAAAYAAHFSEDVVLQPPNAPAVRGREALEAWGSTFPPIENLTWSNLEVQGEGDLAYAMNDYVLQMEGAPADQGKQLGVYRRAEGGGWEIVAVSFNSDNPIPTSETK